LPDTFELHANYPNPFNPRTTLRFDLPEKQYVRITIYNVLGQKIRTFLNKSMQAGRHHVRFDASDLTSGIYIYVIQTENEAATGKMLLLK